MFCGRPAHNIRLPAFAFRVFRILFRKMPLGKLHVVFEEERDERKQLSLECVDTVLAGTALLVINRKQSFDRSEILAKESQSIASNRRAKIYLMTSLSVFPLFSYFTFPYLHFSGQILEVRHSYSIQLQFSIRLKLCAVNTSIKDKTIITVSGCAVLSYSL